VDLVGTPTNNSAQFTVTGQAATAFTVTLPADGATTIANGSNTMGVNFTLNTGAGALTSGTEQIYVGGTLSVSATQAAGSYTGTFPVTVAYN
jgi:X-X-X-Leu-X-X-Gly heptad repeat protein